MDLQRLHYASYGSFTVWAFSLWTWKFRWPLQHECGVSFRRVLTPHLTEASVLPGGRVPLSGLSRLEILSLLADWTWNSQNDTCNDPPQVI